MQAVLDDSGKLLSRTVIADPYGEDAESINGPAVDKITIKGTKDSSGNVSEVKVSLHLTEPVDAATINGVHLAPTTATPIASDPYTITWTLNGAVTNDLKIEGAETLRSQTFGPSTPVLFAAFTISATDIAQRFASTSAGSTFTSTPYNITSLALLGTRDPTDISAALVMSPFKAHPYTDPFTGLDYVRARWMDRARGTFLTPDPAGYRDSSNLYAYCAGDPVNCQDPTGQAVYVVYRALDVRGGGAVFPKLGHVHLAFDSEGLPDPKHWRALVNRIGGQRGKDSRLRRDPNPEAETFSFHPRSVLTESEENNLASTAVTIGSYVGYNDARADQIPFRRAVRELDTFGPTPVTKWHQKGSVAFRIPATQQQQEQLYVAAIAERGSINSGLNQFGSYTVGSNDCGSWAQSMILRAGLKWPIAGQFFNLGVGVGGPASGLASVGTAAVTVVGYEFYGLSLLKEDWMKQNSKASDPQTQDWVKTYNETMQKAGALPIP